MSNCGLLDGTTESLRCNYGVSEYPPMALTNCIQFSEFWLSTSAIFQRAIEARWCEHETRCSRHQDGEMRGKYDTSTEGAIFGAIGFKQPNSEYLNACLRLDSVQLTNF